MSKLSSVTSKVGLDTYKICSKCKVEKTICEFSNSKDRKDGKNCRCKSCDAAYFANRSEETRKKEKERLESGRYDAYYAEYRKNHKGITREYDKAYRALNRYKRNSTEAKRHANKLNATPPWLTEKHFLDIKAVYFQARDCQIVTGESYHVDHIVPLQGKNVCGLHVPWNLQVLPAEVNIRKNNRYEQTP